MARRAIRWLSTIAALSLVYFVASKLGLRLAVLNPSATAVWPGTGIALAALLVLGFDVWPGIFVGSFLVNITTAGTVATSIGIASGNTLEALLGAFLVYRFAHGRRAFDRADDVFKFALFAGMIGTAVAASIGVTALYLGGLTRGEDVRSIWLTWWLGDMVGAIVLAPFLVLWSARPALRGYQRNGFQAAAAATSVVLIGLVLFGDFLPSTLQNFPLAFLCIPLVVWAAFHLRLHEISAAVVALSSIAIWGSMHGLASLGASSRNETLLLLQAFMGVIAMTGLVVSAVVSERERDAVSRIWSENRLQLAQAAAQIGTWEWDPVYNKSSLSAELHEMFGTDVSDPNHDAKWAVRVDPEDRARVQAEMEAGNRAGVVELEYQFRHPTRGLRWYYCKGARISHDEPKMFGVVLDITDRKRVEEELKRAHAELEARVTDRTAELRAAQESLRALSSRLLQMQDEERRRIARELHDSSGQVLAALNLHLGTLRDEAHNLSPKSVQSLKESIDCVRQLSKELRTMSYLLHPPLLDEMGLQSAMAWYVEGFSERSSIPVKLDVSPFLGRLSRELETAIFRIVQECLTNIHRHSESLRASVCINSDAEWITVRVSDEGKGIPAGKLEGSGVPVRPGVGIQGMKERVRQLGGRLEIQSGGKGTTVITMLPVAEIESGGLKTDVQTGISNNAPS